MGSCFPSKRGTTPSFTLQSDKPYVGFEPTDPLLEGLLFRTGAFSLSANKVCLGNLIVMYTSFQLLEEEDGFEPSARLFTVPTVFKTGPRNQWGQLFHDGLRFCQNVAQVN